MQALDLIEDVWLHIFSFSQLNARAQLQQVCKRWRTIVLNPIIWKSIEWAERDRRNAAKSFGRFFFTYCTSVEDLILDIHIDEGNLDFLNQLFQMRHLRRVALTLRSSLLIPTLTQPPLCKDLKILYIKKGSGVINYDVLLRGLPSLEELYVDCAYTNPEVFATFKKLRRLSILPKNRDEKIEDFIRDSLPNVKLVVLDTGYPINVGATPKPMKINNAVVVHKQALLYSLHDIMPLIEPSLDPKIDIDVFRAASASSNYPKDLLIRLVKERGFDPNALDLPNKFRPTLTLVYQSSREYALKDAVHSGHTNQITLLISLGADPNSPLQDDSPLLHAQASDVYKLLLSLGSDPNKLVNGIPVFMYLLLVDFSRIHGQQKYVRFEEVADDLIGKCDFNKKYRGRSFVDIALKKLQPSSTFDVLIAHKVIKWTPDQLELMFTTSRPTFYNLLRQTEFDLSLLKPSTVVQAHASLLPSMQLLPQFKKIHKDQQPDESGLSLVHHVALIDSSFESGLPSSYPAPLTYIYNVETRWSPRPAVNQFKVIPSTATSELYDNMDAAVNIPIPVIPFTGDMSNFIGEVYVPGMDMPPWANHVPGHLTEHNTMPQGYPHPVPLMPPNLIPLPPQLIPLPYSVQQHLAGVQRLPPQPPHVIPQMQQPQEIETHNQLGQFIIMPPMPDKNNPPLGQLNQIFPQFPPQFQPPQRTFGHGQMSFPVNQTLQPPPPTSPPPPWTPTPQFISQGPAYLPRQIIMSNLAQPRLHYPKMAAQLGNPGQPTIMYNQYSSMTSQQASPYPTIGLSSYIHINLQNLEELVASQREFINILSQFGETPLLLLCKSSLTESVKLTNARLLLAVGADVNIADNRGWTPLHAALYCSAPGLAQLLLEHGANINAQDDLGITPLMYWFYGVNADNKKPLNVLQATLDLLQHKDIDFTLTDKNFNRSVIHLMACVAAPSCLDLVLKGSAPHVVLEARDVDGLTPLHHAVMYCNYDMIAYLIQHGANVNAQSYALKLTPLMMYMVVHNRENHEENDLFLDKPLLAPYKWLMHCNTMMLSSATNTDLRKYFSLVEPAWIARSRSENPEKTLKKPLLACSNADQSFPWKFLERTDLALTDRFGNTILHFFVMDKGKAIFADLDKSNPPFSSLWDCRNTKGDTPLHLLLERCKVIDHEEPKFTQIISLIKACQINLHVENNNGVTCFQLLMTMNSLLLSEKRQVVEVAKKGPNPVPTAVHSRHAPSTSILHSMLRTPQPVTLDVALVKNIVMQFKHELNAQDENGNTPLMALVQAMFTEKVLGKDNMKYETSVVRRIGNPRQNNDDDHYDDDDDAYNNDDYRDEDVVVQESVDLAAVVEYLITCPGADLTAQNHVGDTVLHIVCRFFHVGALEAMLCNFNSFNHAAKYCLIAFKLLDAGAQVTIKNKCGKTVLDYAPLLMYHYQHIYPCIRHYKPPPAEQPEIRVSVPTAEYDLSLFTDQ